jgi:hypothetical protein
MSQREPYEVVHRTPQGVKRGRNFASLAAARRYARRHGFNTIVQKKAGEVGYRIIETVAPAAPARRKKK